MTKSVVMLAHAFPPEGNAGTYRPLRFVRHLAKAGWETSVVSAEMDRYERYDPGLLALVPQETEVVRVRAWDPWQALQARRSRKPQNSSGATTTANAIPSAPIRHSRLRAFARSLVHTAETWCYHPDPDMGWIRPATKATIALCTWKQPQVIWATGAPWSSFIVARRASRQTRVPYVLDFRSSWTIVPNDFESRRPGWAQRRDRRVLYELFTDAQAVIFAYDTEAECYWRSYRGALDAARIHIIPNGYDGTIEKFVAPTGDKCVVLYAGTLDYRYDSLLHALHELKKTDPTQANQLRFVFIGEGIEPLARDVARLDLADIVHTRGPVPFAEIGQLQRAVHALLILGRPETMKGHDMLAGAKLFGYLQAGCPIIGVLPQDEGKKILARVGVSTVADVQSIPEILTVLRQLLNAWATNALSRLVPDPDACAVYSAEQQTAALMKALEGAPASEPFIPGAVEIPPSLRQDLSKDWQRLRVTFPTPLSSSR